MTSQATITILDTVFGKFETQAHEFDGFDYPIVTLANRSANPKMVPYVRIHSACLFSESFHSNHCDCEAQLNESMRLISSHSGAIIYMPQEGRGAGLCAKIKAMEIERVSGIDTVEAFKKIGLVPDLRDYVHGIQAMRDIGIDDKIKIVTNNPHKIQACENAGIVVIERLEPALNLPNLLLKQMQDKQRALGHYVYTR